MSLMLVRLGQQPTESEVLGSRTRYIILWPSKGPVVNLWINGCTLPSPKNTSFQYDIECFYVVLLLESRPYMHLDLAVSEVLVDARLLSLPDVLSLLQVFTHLYPTSSLAKHITRRANLRTQSYVSFGEDEGEGCTRRHRQEGL